MCSPFVDIDDHEEERYESVGGVDAFVEGSVGQGQEFGRFVHFDGEGLEHARTLGNHEGRGDAFTRGVAQGDGNFAGRQFDKVVVVAAHFAAGLAPAEEF